MPCVFIPMLHKMTCGLFPCCRKCLVVYSHAAENTLWFIPMLQKKPCGFFPCCRKYLVVYSHAAEHALWFIPMLQKIPCGLFPCCRKCLVVFSHAAENTLWFIPMLQKMPWIRSMFFEWMATGGMCKTINFSQQKIAIGLHVADCACSWVEEGGEGVVALNFATFFCNPPQCVNWWRTDGLWQMGGTTCEHNWLFK